MHWSEAMAACSRQFLLLQARTDELRIQKRFLNDMFARVKQEYLERRLRQQQIEQLLGYKFGMAALPSTAAADAPGPSNALALRAASEGPSEAQEASPGETASHQCLPFLRSTAVC